MFRGEGREKGTGGGTDKVKGKERRKVWGWAGRELMTRKEKKNTRQANVRNRQRSRFTGIQVPNNLVFT